MKFWTLLDLLRAPEGESDGGGGGGGDAANQPPTPPEVKDETPAWAKTFLENQAKFEKRIADQGRQLAALKENR